MPRSDPVGAWTAALSAAGLPLAIGGSKAGRARISFAAPLPAGMAGEAELADIVLTERRPRADVVERLSIGLPAGDRLVDLYDVWLGEPALAGRVVAADFRLTVRGADPAGVSAACARLLAAPTLERIRSKGADRAVSYDLRPLILDLAAQPAPRRVEADPSSRDATVVTMRLRMGQEGAAGRPGEVVLALADAVGASLDAETTVRERLLTLDDPAERG